jgi:hypothetical protein
MAAGSGDHLVTVVSVGRLSSPKTLTDNPTRALVVISLWQERRFIDRRRPPL